MDPQREPIALTYASAGPDSDILQRDSAVMADAVAQYLVALHNIRYQAAWDFVILLTFGAVTALKAFDGYWSAAWPGLLLASLLVQLCFQIVRPRLKGVLLSGIGILAFCPIAIGFACYFRQLEVTIVAAIPLAFGVGRIWQWSRYLYPPAATESQIRKVSQAIANTLRGKSCADDAIVEFSINLEDRRYKGRMQTFLDVAIIAFRHGPLRGKLFVEIFSRDQLEITATKAPVWPIDPHLVELEIQGQRIIMKMTGVSLERLSKWKAGPAGLLQKDRAN